MAMTSPALRDRYLADSVNTASPAKLLIMLYDRLILELRTTLDLDAWDGAAGLANLYGWLLTELIGANIKRDADRVAACRTLVEPLRDAWREAATLAADGN
jgi:flagellar protein FliS